MLFQKRQPGRSHQILSSEFGKNGWAKSGMICAVGFFRKDSRADHARFCPLSRGDRVLRASHSLWDAYIVSNKFNGPILLV